MNFILFDDHKRKDLYPLTLTRPMADIRIGIMTIREKWEHFLKSKTSTLTEDYLNVKYPIVKEENNMLINGAYIPDKALVDKILQLKPGQILVGEDCIIAQYITAEELEVTPKSNLPIEEIPVDLPCFRLSHPWDIFDQNAKYLLSDFEILTRGRKSAELSSTNNVIGREHIFIEEGAHIEYATINAATGPVYIGHSAEIMEGSLIRGPFALLDHAKVRMGAKIYGPVTIGPWSKVGGEVCHSVFFGYSNKAHDGFIGHSVIGEWCNFGAGTCISDLKNTYEQVKVWSYTDTSFINTGMQFCGLIMGDHSKTGINTMFNTGTVVGVFANIFGAGFPRQFMPSFTWGGPHGIRNYGLNKAYEVAEEVFRRRAMEFSQVEKDMLKAVYNLTFEFKQDMQIH